ncbi:MAG: DUF1674 domain-containing protein [Pseudomonadota bacterium]
MTDNKNPPQDSKQTTDSETSAETKSEESANSTRPKEIGGSPKEIGGREGLDPTRYGDWEKNGRCIDF